MALYSDVVLPHLCDFAMRNRELLPYRKRVVGSARGRRDGAAVDRGGTESYIVTAAREMGSGSRSRCIHSA